jgi:hypothetical protein
MKKFFTLTFMIIYIVSTFNIPIADAAVKPIIVILPFQINNVSESTELIFFEGLYNKFAESDRFKIVEWDLVEEALNTVVNNSRCNELDCAIKIGRSLNADKVLMGDLGKTGSGYTADAKLVNLGTQKVENEKYAEYDCTIYELPELGQFIAQLFLEEIPVAGRVMGTSEEGIWVDLGETDGIAEGMELTVEKFVDPTNYERNVSIYRYPRQEIGTIEVIYVDKNHSIAEIVKSDEKFYTDDIVFADAKEIMTHKHNIERKQITKKWLLLGLGAAILGGGIALIAAQEGETAEENSSGYIGIDW